MQSCHLKSVRQGSTLLGWFCLFVVVLVTVLCFSFFIKFCFIPRRFLIPSPFTTTPPPNCLSFAHFCALTFPFWSLYSLFLISLVVAASELTECLCHAVCLKPWFYCCRTKRNLMWLLGCYLQFISLSAALVKRTLSRYFFFIIFQIIFFTVYNNPLKAWNLNLSLPRSSPSYIHTGLLL